MMGYIDNLAKLDAPISQELATDIILQSLLSSFDQFILNYNMNNLTKTLTELHGMLKTAEPNIRKDTLNVLMVQGGKKFKKFGKNKGKGKISGIENPPKSDLLLSSSLARLAVTNVIFVMALGIGRETALNSWKI